MPSLNQLWGGKVWDRIALKKQWKDVVMACARTQKLTPMAAVLMRYTFFERRGGNGRDPSNIFAAAMKIVEDGLVEAGILKDDHQGIVRGIVLTGIFHRPAKPGVLVTLEEVPIK
jgi:hypothetical protein